MDPVAVAKVNYLSRYLAGYNSFATNLSRIRRVSTTGARPQSSGAAGRQIGWLTSGFSGLSRSQRGWLAKGVSGWAREVSEASQPSPPERPLNSYYLDLNTYLVRRHVEANRRRATMGIGRLQSALVRPWFRELQYTLLWRLESALNPRGAAPQIIAALKASTSWVEAAGFRLDAEASIPKMLIRLASVISPNAPSRLAAPRPSHLRRVALST